MNMTEHSAFILFLMWQDYNTEAEKNNKKRKSWLEWLLG